MTSLYSPIQLGELSLRNRVFMAPLTRNRADPDGTPGPWAETYYRQRSSAGLIITEATQISAMGKGYINTPGIYLPEHIAGWRRIMDGRPLPVTCASPRPACWLWIRMVGRRRSSGRSCGSK